MSPNSWLGERKLEAMEEEDAQTLSALGLTRSQAVVYLTLIKSGKMNGKAIWNNCSIARQEIYRILAELQKKGIVEKILAVPTEFKAVPLQDCLSTLLKLKNCEYLEAEKNVKKLLQRLKVRHEEIAVEANHLSLIAGKESIIRKFENARDNSKESIAGIYFWKGFVNMITDGFEEYKKILSKGIEIRFIIYRPQVIKTVSRMIPTLKKNGSLGIRCTPNAPPVTITIFDKKTALISFEPKPDPVETSLFWSNNPHFALMFQNYFEEVWHNSTEATKFENRTKRVASTIK